MVLKHKTNGMAAQLGECVVIKRGGFLAIDGKQTLCGPVQQTNDVQQCAFARALGPHHCTKLATFQNQIDVVQYFDFIGLTHIEGLAHTLEFYNSVRAFKLIHE